MKNAIYANPCQNLCLAQWLEFTLAGKEIWTPQKDDIPCCKKDYRSEALDIERHAVGIYKEDRLAGHVPI